MKLIVAIVMLIATQVLAGGLRSGSSAARTTIISSGKLALGRNPSGTRYFPGDIGFAGIAYKTLTSNEIVNVYNLTMGYYQ